MFKVSYVKSGIGNNDFIYTADLLSEDYSLFKHFTVSREDSKAISFADVLHIVGDYDPNLVCFPNCAHEIAFLICPGSLLKDTYFKVLSRIGV